MIKIIEKDFLKDDVINKIFASNITSNERIYFKKEDIYYFGNYDKSKLDIIQNKINSNKNNIKKAVESGIRFLITGNSIELFNNNFNHKNINLYNCLNKKSKKIKIYDNLIKIDSENFRYKNLIVLKKQSK